MHFVVSGVQLAASAVERAIALSHEKYCSATIMLGKTAEIVDQLRDRRAPTPATRRPRPRRAQR